jgi:hypothetical protein
MKRSTERGDGRFEEREVLFYYHSPWLEQRWRRTKEGLGNENPDDDGDKHRQVHGHKGTSTD